MLGFEIELLVHLPGLLLAQGVDNYRFLQQFAGVARSADCCPEGVCLQHRAQQFKEDAILAGLNLSLTLGDDIAVPLMGGPCNGHVLELHFHTGVVGVGLDRHSIDAQRKAYHSEQRRFVEAFTSVISETRRSNSTSGGFDAADVLDGDAENVTIPHLG